MLFPSSSAAAPLLALLLLLAAVSPPGAALELPSPLVDVAVLAMGAEPGSAEALPMNAPQTEVRGRANARENRRLAAHDSSCMLQYLPVQPSGRTAAATREEPDRDDDGQQCSTRVRLLQARPDSRARLFSGAGAYARLCQTVERPPLETGARGRWVAIQGSANRLIRKASGELRFPI